MRFGTKAETLAQLAGGLQSARVLPQFRLCAEEWAADRAGRLAALEVGGWLGQLVIVRSSAGCEDGAAASHAGEFDSVPNVRGADAVVRAIDQVFGSYRTPHAGDQVFLQPQLAGPELSGVACGLDPQSGGPYVVVNYDRGSAIGGVTAGVSPDAETYYWFRGSAPPDDPRLAGVIRLLGELEHRLGTPALDVEFAWADGDLYLLQVRRLTGLAAPPRLAADVAGSLRTIAGRVAGLPADPRILGSGIALGVMPDWNPAEMIGLNPRPLAASLYCTLITGRTWAEQRADYGYRDLRGVPLMHLLGGQPYIDVRASFTSFVPAELPDDVAGKLVGLYLDALRARPELHDKVELDIVLHCATFETETRLAALAGNTLSAREQRLVVEALQRLTRRVVSRPGPWYDEHVRHEFFGKWLMHHDPNGPRAEAGALWDWLQQCRSRGARLFAGHARAGFIAVCLLRSLVRIGLFSEADEDRFIRSLRSVARGLCQARRALGHTLTRDRFLRTFGHLRPGTYDIRVPRYDEALETYLRDESAGEPETEEATFTPTPHQRAELERLLPAHGFAADVDSFLKFLREAIECRESGKFVYSRGVSDFLRSFGRYAANLGLTLEECADVDVAVLPEIAAGADARTTLRRSIDAHRAAAAQTQGLALPPLILSEADLWSYHLPRYQPNFTTRGCVTGPVRTPADRDLAGGVLLLPCADPGYDWIFTAGIAGFVTQYGGANSHMAIRARELHVPAAIGVGEPRYRQLARARIVRLDCQNRQLLGLP